MHSLQGRESADGQQMQLEPVPGNEPHALPNPSSALVHSAAQHHTSSTGLAMAVAARETQAKQPSGFSGVQCTPTRDCVRLHVMTACQIACVNKPQADEVARLQCDMR